MKEELCLEFGFKDNKGFEDKCWYNEGRFEIRYFLWNYIKYILGNRKQLRKYFKWGFGAANHYLTPDIKIEKK